MSATRTVRPRRKARHGHEMPPNIEGVVMSRGKLYHYFSGNDTPPEATGLSRGLVAAALMGIVSAVLRLIPIDTDAKLDLIGYLAPAITLVSFVAFGYLEKFLRRSGVDIDGDST